MAIRYLQFVAALQSVGIVAASGGTKDWTVVLAKQLPNAMQRAFKSWNFVLTLAGACRTCSPNDGRKASLVRMSLEVDARTQSSQLPLHVLHNRTTNLNVSYVLQLP